MSLIIGDNFSYGGSKPLDARLKYSTLAEMVAMADSTLYDGIMAYCVATDKTYQWKSANDVDETLGKWREFTSSGIPTKTSDLINDSGFITNMVNNLVNYYLKSELYTKTEVDSLISAIVTLDIRVVSTLPTENISRTTIYLVPSASAQTRNIKDEYINLDGTSAGWELIGSTDIDLTGYVTDAELTTALADYVTSTGLTTILVDYVTTTDMEDALADKADTDDIPTAMTAEDLDDVKDAFTPNTGAPLRMMNYSTEEQVVGTWIDGKTLYQKTIDCGALPNNATKSVAHGIQNVDKYVGIEGIFMNGYVAGAFNFAGTSSIAESVTAYTSDENTLVIATGMDRRSSVGYVTLQYTKTTD